MTRSPLRSTRWLARSSPIGVAILVAACATTPSTGEMSFFVSSVGKGNGADLEI